MDDVKIDEDNVTLSHDDSHCSEAGQGDSQVEEAKSNIGSKESHTGGYGNHKALTWDPYHPGVDRPYNNHVLNFKSLSKCVHNYKILTKSSPKQGEVVDNTVDRGGTEENGMVPGSREVVIREVDIREEYMLSTEERRRESESNMRPPSVAGGGHLEQKVLNTLRTFMLFREMSICGRSSTQHG